MLKQDCVPQLGENVAGGEAEMPEFFSKPEELTELRTELVLSFLNLTNVLNGFSCFL